MVALATAQARTASDAQMLRRSASDAQLCGRSSEDAQLFAATPTSAAGRPPSALAAAAVAAAAAGGDQQPAADATEVAGRLARLEAAVRSMNRMLTSVGEGSHALAEGVELGLGRFVPPLIHFTLDLLTWSAPLFLKRRCDRTPGGTARRAVGAAGARAAVGHGTFSTTAQPQYSLLKIGGCIWVQVSLGLGRIGALHRRASAVQISEEVRGPLPFLKRGCDRTPGRRSRTRSAPPSAAR